MTNVRPQLADPSGALPSRFVILKTAASFLGREDHGLTDKLLAELPGILNWSVQGYRRLRERGRFIEPASAQEALEQLELLGSPIKAFLSECCEVGPGLSVP